MSKSNEVCEMYYKDKCHVCPLRPGCCKKISPGAEGLNKWMQEVEEVAEEILSTTSENIVKLRRHFLCVNIAQIKQARWQS